MLLLKITGEVYMFVDDDDVDEEELAQSFQSGFKGSLEHFPDADVAKAEVRKIEHVPDQEAEDEGLVE